MGANRTGYVTLQFAPTDLRAPCGEKPSSSALHALCLMQYLTLIHTGAALSGNQSLDVGRVGLEGSPAKPRMWGPVAQDRND